MFHLSVIIFLFFNLAPLLKVQAWRSWVLANFYSRGLAWDCCSIQLQVIVSLLTALNLKLSYIKLIVNYGTVFLKGEACSRNTVVCPGIRYMAQLEKSQGNLYNAETLLLSMRLCHKCIGVVIMICLWDKSPSVRKTGQPLLGDLGKMKSSFPWYSEFVTNCILTMMYIFYMLCHYSLLKYKSTV